MAEMNRAWTMAAYPRGEPTPSRLRADRNPDPDAGAA